MKIRTAAFCAMFGLLGACAASQPPADTAPVYGSPGTITLADLAAVDSATPVPEESDQNMEGRLFEILWREAYAGTTPSDPRYPVVLSDRASQRRLGLMVANYGPYDDGPELTNKCYYYGDGGNLVSVSDAVLAIYRARGFTQQTLCMGLVSGILYDPASGARLATVIMADLKELASPDFMGEPGAISEELPIELPDCFARGLPLVDCRFTYHPFTGAKLDSQDAALITHEGQRALQAGRDLITAGKYGRPCAAGLTDRALEDESCYTPGDTDGGYFSREYRVSANHPVMLPFGGFYDFGPEFEEGFAYAIFADGAAGPSASMESVSLALTGKNRASSASLDALKIAAGGG